MRIYEFLVKHKQSIKDVFSNSEELKKCVKSYDDETGRIEIETSAPLTEIESKLATLFSQIKLVGVGNSSKSTDVSGVAIIGGPSVRGVVRLFEDEGSLFAEGTVSGLHSGTYSVSVNQFGDISNSCISTGDPIMKKGDASPSGTLGDIKGAGEGDTRFVLMSERLSISECIGRSLVLRDLTSKVACGIVGRSSGVLENNKKICACDGKVIWEEQVFGPFSVAPPTGIND